MDRCLMMVLICLQIIFSLLVGHTQTQHIKGVVPLNNQSFNKIVPKWNAVLVKFDELYPYGAYQNAFEKLAEQTAHLEDFLLAEANVGEYHEYLDRGNADLRIRFNLQTHLFPTYALFLKGQAEPIYYKGNKRYPEYIIKFIMQEAGIGIGLAACIDEFDEIAEEFLQLSPDDKTSIEKLLSTVEAKTNGITDNMNKRRRAQMYGQVMEKLITNGIGYLKTEIDRLEKILAEGWISKEKTQQLKDKIQILTKFHILKKQMDLDKFKRKDEL